MLALKQILLSGMLVFVLALGACNSNSDPIPNPGNGSTTPPAISEEKPTPPAHQENYVLYFNNIQKDPKMLDCEVVYPTTRSYKKGINYEEVLTALLNGPTKEEESEGFVPVSVRSYAINYVIISGNTAKIDFKILEISGSCAVASFRAQLTETFKQFPGVSTVAISLLGESEGILEP